MTKGPNTPMASAPVPPDQQLDRRAIRRAHSSVSALPELLPEASVSMLAREVISRLADRGQGHVACDAMIANLTEALLSRDEGMGLRIVQKAIGDGTPVEDIYLVYLTGAARKLGDRWEQDNLTATQVTIAAARFYAILRGLSMHLVPENWPDGRFAVFATVPGEQHTLGITMAADLFRREGWLIDLKVGRQHDDLLRELADTDFAILGLSATSKAVLPELIRLIAAIRVSFPHVRIIVSGHLAETEPQLRQLTDADCVSTKLDALRVVMRDLHDTITAQPGVARG